MLSHGNPHHHKAEFQLMCNFSFVGLHLCINDYVEFLFEPTFLVYSVCDRFPGGL